MDVLAHTLWANAAARGGNQILKRKQKPERIHAGWAAFWGVFPDLFAFAIPTGLGLWQAVQGGGVWWSHHGIAGGFDIASYLYQYSHSLVVWAVVFFIVWVIKKRAPLELLGWALHILIDIPSHSINFYPTPFLFPVSEYRFPYGVSWGNRWYMIINYTALLVVWGGILYKKYQKR